jgi:hypothetical protein
VTSVADQLIDDIASFQHDPLGYVQYAFPWGEPGKLEEAELRAWQAETLDTIGRHLRDPGTRHQPCLVAVASGHGIGKSALFGMLSKWALDTMPDTRIVITANTEDQLRGKTWPEVCSWHRQAITHDWFRLGASVIESVDPDHRETWQCRLTTWSKNNTEAFAGLHNKGRRILLIMDEASAIEDKVWEVAEGALTDSDTEIIWVVFGNPTRATGRFRECFRRLKHRWHNQQIDSRDVDGTNTELFQRWVDDYGEDSDFVKVRVRGIFPALSAKQFIAEPDVDAAYGRSLRPEQYEFAPVVIGCDPAWQGDDELVIVKRQGLASWVLHRQGKNDNDVEVANLLARLQDEHRAAAVFIDLGYGTGIASAGRTMGRHWMLVNFGSKPTDKGCLNKRSEMWRDMRDWLKQGGSIPPVPQIRDELIGPETVARLDGKIALEPKEAMKQRGLVSPNIADALALTFAFPVSDPALGPNRRKSKGLDHDPFGM